ncbi:MATE family efflux transporter [Lentisphaerota bacterium WC36G]|nr:MATE family efflux transporter [Lentisphaerae bacterium WC36]
MSESSISSNIMVRGKVVPTFFLYSLPWVLALLAQSSAGVVDGIFIGQYCGTQQLAATNLVFPVYSVFMAISIVFCVGGVVRYAKYIGENDITKADAIFTKVIFTMIFFSVIFVAGGFIFNDSVMKILGVNNNVLQYSQSYFNVLLAFVPAFMIGITLSSFIRADGNVMLAGIAPMFGVGINIFLDYLLIAKYEMGVVGAAYATGASQVVALLILCGHFFLKKNNLRFTKNIGSLKEVALAAYNGSSELFSEMSTGVIILLYNRTLMQMVGENGVAAFTIVGYLSFIVMMISYGVSDNLGPLVSANYGAKNKKRVIQFLLCTVAFVFLVGIMMVSVLSFASENFILMFIDKNQVTANEVIKLTLDFIAIYKWGFLLCGVNIVLATFFTGLHLPAASLIVAILRGFILPITLLTYLPKIASLNLTGVYIAMPISEVITFSCAIIILCFVWKKRSKELT